MALKVDLIRLTLEVFMTLRCDWAGLASARIMTEVVLMDIVNFSVNSDVVRNYQLIQNWYELRESDCLIKTKHCEVQ